MKKSVLLSITWILIIQSAFSQTFTWNEIYFISKRQVSNAEREAKIFGKGFCKNETVTDKWVFTYPCNGEENERIAYEFSKGYGLVTYSTSDLSKFSTLKERMPAEWVVLKKSETTLVVGNPQKWLVFAFVQSGNFFLAVMFNYDTKKGYDGHLKRLE